MKQQRLDQPNQFVQLVAFAYLPDIYLRQINCPFKWSFNRLKLTLAEKDRVEFE